MRNFVQLNGTGIISFELPVRPVNNQVTASIFSSNGSLIASNDASLGVPLCTVDVRQASFGAAVLTVAAAAGSLSFTGNVSTYTKGKRYLLGVSEEQNGEMITVRSNAGGVVTPLRPLINSFAVGDSITDPEVRVTVPTSSTGEVSVNNYIRLSYTGSVSGLSGDAIHKSFDITRYIPVTTLSIEDLRDFDPQLAKKGLAGLSINAIMKKAWEQILARVGARGNMSGLVGSVDLTVPHSYLTRRMIAELDMEQKEYADMLALRFNEEFESIVGVTAHDANGDGAINSWERFRNTVSWVRT